MWGGNCWGGCCCEHELVRWYWILRTIFSVSASPCVDVFLRLQGVSGNLPYKMFEFLFKIRLNFCLNFCLLTSFPVHNSLWSFAISLSLTLGSVDAHGIFCVHAHWTEKLCTSHRRPSNERVYSIQESQLPCRLLDLPFHF